MDKLNFQALQTGIDALINRGFWFALALVGTIVAKDWFVLLYRSISVKLRHDFRVGDHIVMEGYEGEVISTSGFRIRLRTKNGDHIIIPISLVFEKAHKVKGVHRKPLDAGKNKQ